MTSNMAGAAKNSSAVKSQFSNPKFETSDLKFQISDFRPETSDPNSEIPPRTLRELLLADLVDRLHLPAEAFVVKFSASDEKLVSLSEPLFRFEVQCRNPRGIGDVTWDVNVITDGGKQKAAVSATVGIWQVQLVAARPVGYQQVFTDADVIEKRIVVDQIREGSPLGKEQVVGQQANQGIGAGTVISSRMVEPLQVVRTGQLVTVTVEYGSVQIKWVGEARESGAVGQTIRVKKVKDGSRDEFNVTLTGPQEGKLAVGVKVAAR
jgi:flagella basal body P-ring formation protein FlgA